MMVSSSNQLLQRRFNISTNQKFTDHILQWLLLLGSNQAVHLNVCHEIAKQVRHRIELVGRTGSRLVMVVEMCKNSKQSLAYVSQNTDR